MYYKYYDPTIHDIYLYGPGNVGMPIGVNPNSLIYGASADFASLLPRYRSFSVTGPAPIPPGSGVTSLPNYYNNSSPQYIIVGDKTLAGNCHYSANMSSDSLGNFFNAYGKYTGTTTAYPALTITAWNNDLSGFCSYGPFTGMYNCVPLNQITGSTVYARPRYFSGSPEIPGFATGATFYQILSEDCGFFDLIGSGPTFTQPIAKKISPSTLVQELIEQGMTAEYSTSVPTTGNFQLTIPCVNVFIWDGNDKIIPVYKMKFNYSYFYPAANQYPQVSPITYEIVLNTPVNGEMIYAIWVGDSSSQLLYMKNNSLYFLGGLFQGGENYGVGMLYCADSLPLYNFLQNRLVDKNHYSTPFHEEVSLATKINFNTLETTLNNFNTSVNSLYQKWTT